MHRARNNGRSTDNVRTDCVFDWSNFRLPGHVDRSKFNSNENEVNLRLLLFSCFSCYLSSRCMCIVACERRRISGSHWFRRTSESRKYVCIRRVCVLRNFDMKSWLHAIRAVVYNSRIETDIGIRPLPVTKLPNISTFINSYFQFFILGLWAPKRVIYHIHLTGHKRYVTEQK